MRLCRYEVDLARLQIHAHQLHRHPVGEAVALAGALAELKERNIWIVGADERAAQTLYEADLPESIAWVLGAEGEGMRRLTRESCDLLVRIPMRGEVDSLNVSVSAGVCLFESVRRRVLDLGRGRA